MVKTKFFKPEYAKGGKFDLPVSEGTAEWPLPSSGAGQKMMYLQDEDANIIAVVDLQDVTIKNGETITVEFPPFKVKP